MRYGLADCDSEFGVARREIAYNITAESGEVTNNLGPMARIRETINRVSDTALLTAHLHSVAFEEAPQRVLQAFLGQRSLIVTTWARSGLYEVGSGLGEEPRVRYAECGS